MTATSGELPEGWAWTTVGKLSRVEYGKGLAAADRVQSGNVIIYGSAGPAGKHDEALVHEPVVIVGRKGNAGKVWLANGPSWPIDTTYFVRPPHGMHPKYLAHQLASLNLVEKDSSTTIPSLRRPDLEAALIVIPPMAEQDRIVIAIEEHFSRLDAAKDAILSAQSKTAALSVVSLRSLFSGVWPLRRLGDIARVGSGATPSRTEPRYWRDGSVPWVTSGALNDRRITSPSELITEAALRETSVKLWPVGSVLVAMYGEGKTRGKAAQLAIESTCNQACAAIDFDRSEVDGDYLLAYLNSQYEMNRKLASGGVQPNLNLGLVRAMELPLPPLSKQREIAIRAEEIIDETQRLTENSERTSRLGAALRRSILAAAFSGRLVAQDPNGEPASTLLERVAAERAAAKPTPKTRRKKASK